MEIAFFSRVTRLASRLSTQLDSSISQTPSESSQPFRVQAINFRLSGLLFKIEEMILQTRSSENTDFLCGSRGDVGCAYFTCVQKLLSSLLPSLSEQQCSVICIIHTFPKGWMELGAITYIRSLGRND
jgi:hypothetical protein